MTRQRRRLRAHRGQDARAREGRRGVRARGRAGGRGDRALQGRGPALQGRADRGPGEGPGRGDGLALHQRPVHRPLPRPARAVHQADQVVQAHQRGRRLLARRRRQPDAHARLRHGVPLQGGPGRAPRAPGAGARPRPPQARPRARPVHVQRAVGRVAVLEARGRAGVGRARRVLAQGERAPRLRGGAHADPLRRRAVEAVRPLGRLPRQHVLHRRRGPAHGPQAHELPGAHPDLQVRAPLLPRPADPLRRGRPGAPPRAQRHAPRPAAGAPHHPGRRPHLLHRGAGQGGGAAAAWTSATSSTRRSASSRTWSCRPGPRSAWAATRCGTAPRRR